MPWQCKLITEEEFKSDDYKPKFGDMRFSVKWDALDLAPEYFRDWKDKREPLLVYIPAICGDGEVRGKWFCVDQKCSDRTTGWTVTGTPPNITVNPSINYLGSYHGWLQNGVLSDDVEGRTYPKRGE